MIRIQIEEIRHILHPDLGKMAGLSIVSSYKRTYISAQISIRVLEWNSTDAARTDIPVSYADSRHNLSQGINYRITELQNYRITE